MNSICMKVVYLGSQSVNVPALASCIGLSDRYLNKLPQRFQVDLVPDVCAFLSQNWAMALFHEWFSEFRHITKNDLLQYPQIQQIINVSNQHSSEGGTLLS